MAGSFEKARAACEAKSPGLALEELESVLERMCARGRAAHPTFGRLSDEDFAAHVARCGTPLGGAVETLHAEDLFLACATLAGVPAALEHLRAVHGPDVKRYVRRFNTDKTFLDEVEQQLWDSLLVGANGGPRLATYAGRGALERWIGVSAQRIALMMMRHESVEDRAREEMAAAARFVSSDPELDAIREHYREPFQRALAGAIEDLDARVKVIYRMHFVDGLTLQRIGAAYGVHHSTIVRWLEAARERVLDGAKRRLRAELGLSPEEFDSLARMLVSQLDLNISRVLS